MKKRIKCTVICSGKLRTDSEDLSRAGSGVPSVLRENRDSVLGKGRNFLIIDQFCNDYTSSLDILV